LGRVREASDKVAREGIMRLLDSKFVPAVFWVAFLALGLVTSLDGPDKRRVGGAPAVKIAKSTTVETPVSVGK